MANSGELPPTFAEESSWASYIRDFLLMQETEGIASFSINDDGSSIVSDAASMIFNTRGPRKLSYRRISKRRELWLLNDDALEDTASSPISSPKVNASNQMEKEEESRQNLQAAAGGFDEVRRSKAAHINPGDGNQLREKGL